MARSSIAGRVAKELVQRLDSVGCKIIKTQVNRAGKHVHLLRHISGWEQAMFQEDAADLVLGRATREMIIDRNKGADLADPWQIT